VPLFILNAMIFVPFGQIVGGYLESTPSGIFAYSVNILGSLGGILLFTLLCQYWQPPIVWFAIAWVLLVLLVGKIAPLRWASIVTMGLCMLLFILHPKGMGREYWSPYQYLEISERIENGEVIAYQLDTNHTWFQQVVNLSSQFVAAHPQFFSQVPSEWDAYNLPYHFYENPPNVLVLGAGMGNDVAAAARRLLKDDGILVLKFQAHTAWIARRLHGLLRTVFGQVPMDFYADASKYSSGGHFLLWDPSYT
jgi:hypothetical protein